VHELPGQQQQPGLPAQLPLASCQPHCHPPPAPLHPACWQELPQNLRNSAKPATARPFINVSKRVTLTMRLKEGKAALRKEALTLLCKVSCQGMTTICAIAEGMKE